ncbi:hypothetical protein Btru_041331 [Bulinus truncatus]|nr:hypothetical protein Btru_041331 [Bulinus truncatus]
MSCSMVGEISDESLEQRDYTESLESLGKDHQVQCRALMKQNPKKVICGNDQQEGFPELNDFVPDNVEPGIVESDFYVHSFSIGFEEISDLECYTSDVSSACSYPGMDDFNPRQSTTRGEPQEVCELSDIIQNGNCKLSDVIQNGNREQENLSSRRRNSQLVSLFEVRGPPERSHLLFPRQFHHSAQTETSTSEIRLQNLHEPTESSSAPESLAEDFDAQHLINSFSGSHDRQEINSGTTSAAGCVQEATNFNNHDGYTSCIDVRPQQGVLALTLSFEHLHVTESNQVESFDIHLGHPGPTVVTNRPIQEYSEQLPFPQPDDNNIAIDLRNTMHREHTLLLESALCCQCLLRPPRAISRPCGHCTFCQICAPAGISCPTCFRHIREFDM